MTGRADSAGRDEQLELGLALGQTLRLAGLGPEQSARVRMAWSRFPQSARTGAAETALTWNGDDDAWAAFHETAAQEAAHRIIRAGRGTRLLLHAAAVADDSGRALVLAAPSGTGKTTAAIALGRRWGYLTDETCVIDPSTRGIDPFPKPLSVLGPDGQRPKTQHGPDELGLLRPAPSRVRILGVLQRRGAGDQPVSAAEAGVAPPQLVPLPLLEALQELIPQTSSLSSLPRGLVALIRLIEELGGAWGLRYTDQEQLIALAQRLFEAQELPSHELPDGLLPDWAAVDEQQLRPQGDEATESGLLRRVPVQDAVELQAQQGPLLLLLRGEHFHTLAGLGPLIWSAASHWRRPEDLIEELSGLPGAPEDAGALLADAVEQLVEIGVLERSA